MFATDGRYAVILRAEGNVRHRMALAMPILRRLMNSHRHAEVFSVSAGENEPFVRLSSFSSGQTVAIEAAAEKCFTDAVAIDRIEAMGDGDTGGGGRFHLHALQPLRTLLAAGGSVSQFRVRVIEGDGPLVVDAEHEKGDWRVRLVVMRCSEGALH